MSAAGAVLTPAAVLIPLIVASDGSLSMLLTKRTERLKKHSGQVAFPGGKVDASDLDEVAAALRETREEVGIAASLIEVLGIMPKYETGTGFQITPVVGLLHEGYALQINPQEVDEAFTVPMSFLMNPAYHQRRSVVWESGKREFYAMPYTVEQGTAPENEYFIWGATAAMIRNLYRMLSS